MVTRALYLLLAGFLLLSAGCGDSRATLQLHGQSPLNANDQGESTPVDVRFYQLKNDAKFRSATVDSLWTDDKKILGDDLLGEPATATVFPGNAADAPVPFTVNLDAQAHFLGVLALYHKADADDHRMLLIPIDDAGKETLLFTGYAVALHSSKDH
jgi:type VI secretion system VasD/TssJ family lipoprotein